MSSVLSMKFTVACAEAYLQEMEMHILATCKFRLGRYLPALDSCLFAQNREIKTQPLPLNSNDHFISYHK